MDKTTILTASLFFFDANAKRLIRVYDGMIFGRNGGNERFPDDRQVSREHFKVAVLGTEVFIEDLRSSNKTLINGQAILPGRPTQLRFNDVIEFGAQRLVFTSDADYSEKASERPAASVPGLLGMKARLWPHQRFGRFVNKFVHFEGWDWSSAAFVFFGVVLMICVFVSVREALKPGLAYSTIRVAMKMSFAFLAATFAGAFINYSLVFLKGARWFVRPFYWLPSFIVLLISLFGMQWLTSYPHELTANQITHDCLSAFDAEKCARGTKFHPQGFGRVPPELQARIQSKQ